MHYRLICCLIERGCIQLHSFLPFRDYIQPVGHQTRTNRWALPAWCKLLLGWMDKSLKSLKVLLGAWSGIFGTYEIHCVRIVELPQVFLAQFGATRITFSPSCSIFLNTQVGFTLERKHRLAWDQEIKASWARATGYLVMVTEQGSLMLNLEARMSTYGISLFWHIRLKSSGSIAHYPWSWWWRLRSFAFQMSSTEITGRQVSVQEMIWFASFKAARLLVPPWWWI